MGQFSAERERNFKEGHKMQGLNYNNNPNEILLESDVKKEFKLTTGFIERHAVEMGSFGKPRHFIRKNVEAYLNHLADRKIQKTHLKQMNQLTLRHELNHEVDQLIRLAEIKKHQRRHNGNGKGRQEVRG
jgi:hypothetical protein